MLISILVGLVSFNAHAVLKDTCSISNAEVEITATIIRSKPFGLGKDTFTTMLEGSSIDVLLKKDKFAYKFEKNEKRNDIPVWHNNAFNMEFGATSTSNIDAYGYPVDTFGSLSVHFETKADGNAGGFDYYTGIVRVSYWQKVKSSTYKSSYYEGLVKCKLTRF